MTDTPKRPTPPDARRPQNAKDKSADRIAKVIARAGVASRRDAERMIMEGRVSVNGKKIDSPALDVTPPTPSPSTARSWTSRRKPSCGCITSRWGWSRRNPMKRGGRPFSTRCRVICRAS